MSTGSFLAKLGAMAAAVAAPAVLFLGAGSATADNPPPLPPSTSPLVGPGTGGPALSPAPKLFLDPGIIGSRTPLSVLPRPTQKPPGVLAVEVK